MKLEGVVAATVTPFSKDGVNFEALRALLAKVAADGYHLFPTSSTGEVTKPTAEERTKVMEVAKEVAGGGSTWWLARGRGTTSPLWTS